MTHFSLLLPLQLRHNLLQITQLVSTLSSFSLSSVTPESSSRTNVNFLAFADNLLGCVFFPYLPFLFSTSSCKRCATTLVVNTLQQICIPIASLAVWGTILCQQRSFSFRDRILVTVASKLTSVQRIIVWGGRQIMMISPFIAIFMVL